MTANSIRKQISILLFFGVMHSLNGMEQEGVICKVGTKTPFERGDYDDDYEMDSPEWQFKDQKQSSITKPYIPEEKEENTTCCSMFMMLLNHWNNSHAYMYPMSSFPK